MGLLLHLALDLLGKNVCGFRELDEKLIRCNNKLFLVLDATQHVVGWVVTKSVGHDEIKQSLASVSDFQFISKGYLKRPL